jgi:hypothetical protein
MCYSSSTHNLCYVQEIHPCLRSAFQDVFT